MVSVIQFLCGFNGSIGCMNQIHLCADSITLLTYSFFLICIVLFGDYLLILGLKPSKRIYY